MGKARITSGGPTGLYNIELIKDTTKINALIATINLRLAALVQAISDALTVKNAAYDILETQKAEYNAAAVRYSLGWAEISEVNSAHLDYISALNDYSSKEVAYSSLLQEQESKTKSIAALQKALTADARSNIWCADLTENLAAGNIVSTIEVNGASSHIIIYPGGDEDNLAESRLQPTQASTPSGIFYNWALFAAWQKWKPTYRVGEIKALYDDDLCDVCIDAAVSSVQGLDINQAGTKCQQTIGEISSGFAQFCAENPADPIVTNDDDTTIALTPQLMEDMRSVNSAVNNSHAYQLDIDQYGTEEHWSYMSPGQSGDCEDFALTKLKLMLGLGYPISALKLAKCKTQNGTGHAYLIVQTDEVDYALDLNFSEPIPDGELPYTEKSRQTGPTWYRNGVCLFNVPIEYMDGTNSEAFDVGDRVVVEFTNQDWTQPKVIGFESNPRKGVYLYGIINDDWFDTINPCDTYRYRLGGTFSKIVPQLIQGGKNATWPPSSMNMTYDESEIAVINHLSAMGKTETGPQLNITFYKNDNTYAVSRSVDADLWQGIIASTYIGRGNLKSEVGVRYFGKPFFDSNNDMIYVPLSIQSGGFNMYYLSGFVGIKISTGELCDYYFHNYMGGWSYSPRGPREIVLCGTLIYMVDDPDGGNDPCGVRILTAAFDQYGFLNISSDETVMTIATSGGFIYVVTVEGTTDPFKYSLYAFHYSSIAYAKKTAFYARGWGYPCHASIVIKGGQIRVILTVINDAVLGYSPGNYYTDMFSFDPAAIKTDSPREYSGLELTSTKEINRLYGGNYICA